VERLLLACFLYEGANKDGENSRDGSGNCISLESVRVAATAAAVDSRNSRRFIGAARLFISTPQVGSRLIWDIVAWLSCSEPLKSTRNL
jgi:hypothetical protein